MASPGNKRDLPFRTRQAEGSPLASGQDPDKATKPRKRRPRPPRRRYNNDSTIKDTKNPDPNNEQSVLRKPKNSQSTQKSTGAHSRSNQKNPVDIAHLSIKPAITMRTPDYVKVDFNKDEGIVIAPLLGRAVRPRIREGFHPRVGYSIPGYGRMQDALMRSRKPRPDKEDPRNDFMKDAQSMDEITKRFIAYREKCAEDARKGRREPMNADEIHLMWPYTGSIVLAPFTLNPAYKFDQEDRNQNNSLVKFLKTSSGHHVLKLLFAEGHTTVAQLAMTCLSCFKIVADFAGRWDINTADFNYCQTHPRNLPKLLSPEELRNAGVGSVLQVVNTRIYMRDFQHVKPALPTPPLPEFKVEFKNISQKGMQVIDVAKSLEDRIAVMKGLELSIEDTFPDRLFELLALRHCQVMNKNLWHFNTQGNLLLNLEQWEIDQLLEKTTKLHKNQWEESPEYGIWESTHVQKVTNLLGLVNSLYHYGSNLQILHLHKCPYVDYRMVSILLEACPNLHSLGIYRCELLHLGHVITLLDIVHKFNVSHDRFDSHDVEYTGKDNRLDLDFFPRYHRGPDFGRDGEWGITWNDYPYAAGTLGVFQIITCAVLKAERLGIDLLSRHKAFRAYMEKIPLHLWSVPYFIDAILTYLHWHGKKTLTADEERTLVNDLIFVIAQATEGNGQKTVQFTNRNHDQFREHAYCASCGLTQMRIFFESDQNMRLITERTCAGCELRGVLDNEADHLKGWKIEVLDELVHNNVNQASKNKITAVNKMEAPLLDNKLMMMDTSKLRLPPANETYSRRFKMYADYMDNLWPIRDLADVAGHSDFSWALALRKAKDVDIHNFRQQTYFGTHKDGYRCQQTHKDASGPSSMMTWDKIRRRWEQDKSGPVPGDEWQINYN